MIIGGTTIPIKDCQTKGEHPNPKTLKCGLIKGSRSRLYRIRIQWVDKKLIEGVGDRESAQVPKP